MPKLNHQEALEAVFTGRLPRIQGHLDVPTSLFIEKLDVGMASLPDVALYVFRNGRVDLIKPSDHPYSPLVLSQFDSVWVREEDLPILKKYAETLLFDSEEAGKGGTSEKKLDILRRSALVVVEDLFDHPTPENIDRSTKIVGSFVYVLMKDPKAYVQLTKLSSHDHYTLQHSVGTAVNCIILGRKLGIQSEKELNELGLAGLLHDIGKVKVKKEIINKTGPLDEFEWEEMRQHSLEGYELIKDNPLVSEPAKLAVLEHHEDKNGTGYPYGRNFSEVHLFSKIVALCDIFNAMTTNRTYSKARTPFDTFQFISEKMKHKVDDVLFREMVMVYGGKVE